MNEVRLWPNRKIFEYGIVYSHPKITFTNAERIIKYSLTKENWPMLSWKVWRHMACEKLKIKEELAWVYFETFDSFQELCEDAAKSALDKRSALSLTDFKATRHVNTLQFTLFLYAQTNLRIASLNKSVNEICPWKQISSPQAEWLLNNIDYILKLCSYNSNGQGTISLNGVRGLEFIIKGQLDGTNLPFTRIMSRFEEEMIYNRETQHCSASKLKNFITSHLSDCPISAPHGTSTRLVDRPAKFVGNHLIAPKEDAEFYLRRMVDQTACINDEMLVDSCIKMSKCENSTIYLIGNIKTLHISQCNGCTIVAPSVSGLVRMSKSSKMRLVTYTRCLFLSSITDSTIYSSVATNPVMINCSGIQLAPLNMNHPKMADDVKKAALPAYPNLWDSPIDIKEGRRTSAPEENSFKNLDPKEFFYMSVPFKLKTCETSANSTPRVAKFFIDLPEEYSQAVAHQEKVSRSGRKLTKDPNLTDEMKTNFKSYVNKMFMDWLNETGEQEKLEELYKLESGSHGVPKIKTSAPKIEQSSKETAKAV